MTLAGHLDESGPFLTSTFVSWEEKKGGVVVEKETMISTENPVLLKWTAEMKGQKALSPVTIFTSQTYGLCLVLCTVFRWTQPGVHKAAGTHRKLRSS